MANDIFDDNDRVIDEDADGKDRNAVTTSGARLDVTRAACRCTNAVMSAAVIC